MKQLVARFNILKFLSDSGGSGVYRQVKPFH